VVVVAACLHGEKVCMIRLPNLVVERFGRLIVRTLDLSVQVAYDVPQQLLKIQKDFLGRLLN
jgi:hypothetical protein